MGSEPAVPPPLLLSSGTIQVQNIPVRILEPDHLEPVRAVDAVFEIDAHVGIVLEGDALGAQVGDYRLDIAAAIEDLSLIHI